MDSSPASLAGLDFAGFGPSAADHSRLRIYGGILRVIEQASLSLGSLPELIAQFPFLQSYVDELCSFGVEDPEDAEIQIRWRHEVAAWEGTAAGALPLRSLQSAAGLDDLAIDLLMAIGLIEEDARFGLLFEQLQTASGQRPTLGLLNAWWRAPLDRGEVRGRLRRLQELGLVQVLNPDAPRLAWALHVPPILWDALRGELTAGTLAPGLEFTTPDELPALSELVLSEELASEISALPGLLATGTAKTCILRGPRHNGRTTLARALACELGLGVLRTENFGKGEPERLRQLGPLATLMQAMPVLMFELAPGESLELPRLAGWSGPVVVVLDRFGGVTGTASHDAISVSVEMPDLATRRQLWQRFVPEAGVDEAELLVQRHRLTSGHLRQLASRSQVYASLAGRSRITADDAQRSSRSLSRQVLDLLAARLPPTTGWTELATGAAIQRELQTLEHRCRHREQLQTSLDGWSGRLNAGVRALFSGPSGTGKTLAARALAASLQMDIYRVDLSTVVNKYIGETEKNLNQLFSRAEELDVILLLDEGDALLTRRTDVTTANDRYANLETNYLLQRIESFEGILIVTTNAVERIDGAFQRRMDVIIDFAPPGAEERWHIWQAHLPSGHAVGSALLEEIVSRCPLSGAQIRNAVLHASLLALADGASVTDHHVSAAVQREYLKQGALCPLRRANGSRA